MANLKNFDLNLLQVFEAIYDTRNTRAASDLLRVTQPAVSHALRRLRDQFGDELFVFHQRSMQPTEAAHRIIGPVREVLRLVRFDILGSAPFDPTTAKREFRVAMADIGEMVMAGPIMKRFAAEAPGCVLHWLPVPAQATEYDQLDLLVTSEIDASLVGDYMQQRLYTHDMVGLVAKGHPVAAHPVLDTLRQHPVIVLARSSSVREQVMSCLREAGIPRYHNMVSGRSLTFLTVLEGIDAFAVAPKAVAQMAIKIGNLAVFDLPVAVPELEILQFWHRSHNGDSSSIWLRGLFASVLQNNDPTRTMS
jgi:DNA-binding transcriptional LysR family regulator